MAMAITCCILMALMLWLTNRIFKQFVKISEQQTQLIEILNSRVEKIAWQLLQLQGAKRVKSAMDK